MLKTKRVMLINVGDGLPEVSNIPHGDKYYKLLWMSWLNEYRMQHVLEHEISVTKYDIDKYDYITEPENALMVKQLKTYLEYITICLTQLKEGKKYGYK